MNDQIPALSEETVVCEVDLGEHYLFIKSDQSIELTNRPNALCDIPHVLNLKGEEAYRLLLALVNLFTEEARAGKPVAERSTLPCSLLNGM